MREKLLAILKKDAFFKQKVILASGKESMFYIDVRRVILTPQGLYLISKMLWNQAKKFKFSAIGGPTLGADAMVSGMCFCAFTAGKKNIKGFFIRKEPKKHGRCKMIEGPDLTNKDKVILVDDVATSGGSLLKSIAVLNDQGIKVVAVMTVIDRQEGAQEALAKEGVKLISLFKKSDFMKDE